jgi:hypothetical protein
MVQYRFIRYRKTNDCRFLASYKRVFSGATVMSFCSVPERKGIKCKFSMSVVQENRTEQFGIAVAI